MNRGALSYSLYLLKKRDYSVGDLLYKLKIKGFEKSEIDQTIQKLIEKKFLDDKSYAEKLTRHHLEFKKSSTKKILFELNRHRIKKEDIPESLFDQSNDLEIQNLQSIIQIWIKKRGQIKDYKNREKLIRFLSSRGFSWGDIKSALENDHSIQID